jgi:hypothetical protein
MELPQKYKQKDLLLKRQVRTFFIGCEYYEQALICS